MIHSKESLHFTTFLSRFRLCIADLAHFSTRALLNESSVSVRSDSGGVLLQCSYQDRWYEAILLTAPYYIKSKKKKSTAMNASVGMARSKRHA